MNRQVQQQTITIGQAEFIFFLSAVVILLFALLELALGTPSPFVDLSAILTALAYWTLSFRGLRMLMSGLTARDGAGRMQLIGGLLVKTSSLLLLGDFMLNITRNKAISFFITMMGYSSIGIFSILCFHWYLSSKNRCSNQRVVGESE